MLFEPWTERDGADDNVRNAVLDMKDLHGLAQRGVILDLHVGENPGQITSKMAAAIAYVIPTQPRTNWV